MDKSNKIVLFLTACIDPSKTNNLSWHKLNDSKIRLCQYLEALKFFIENTNLPILFVDNSGYDLSDNKFIKDLVSSGRLEIISYFASEEIRLKGKGQGELDIIRYAMDNSEFIKHAEYIIKITGRVKINNIKDLIKTTINLGLKDKKRKYVIGERLFKADYIQSYFFIAHKDFFNTDFFIQMSNISETPQKLVMFEECLYDSVKNWTKNGGKWHNLYHPIAIEGIKGNGEKYYPGTVRYAGIKTIINAVMANIFKYF